MGVVGSPKSEQEKKVTKIILPNNWKPRDYQRPMWDFLEKGGKRAIGIWHRLP